MQFVTLFTVMQSGVAIVFCGITLIQPQPFSVKVQYLFVIATALMEVFMCARPADHLLDMSENAMQGIYESRWYDQSTSVQKAVSIMLSPQKPVAIKIPCIVPTLSLDYFCSFVTNVFSLFSVLRAAISQDV
ncbi:uncharacterized protein LOC114873771 [Osmia bicornis bicornis]|uniref:uncharacterized protein LOC114873771 n=1 Tax=Osmia bicornis bicornis TaxID=1437191 RepID=UPI001EAF6FD5|nr:uncharacterized protein LOC114873771 [Osmia bicornis bicornis]